MKERIEKLEILLTDVSKELTELKELAKKEEEYKVGEYIYFENPWVGWFKENRVGKIDHVRPSGMYEVFSPEMGNTGGFFPKDLIEYNVRKATNEEIERHLIEEAKKKGFVKGAKVKSQGLSGYVSHFSLVDKITNENNSNSVEGYFKKHGANFLAVHCKSGFCFPINECELITSTPSIEIGEHEVKFKDGFIKVGCKTIASDAIIKLYKAIKSLNDGHNCMIEYVHIDKNNISFRDIKTIAEHFTNKP